jgi:hypothetical protein
MSEYHHKRKALLSLSFGHFLAVYERHEKPLYRKTKSKRAYTRPDRPMQTRTDGKSDRQITSGVLLQLEDIRNDAIFFGKG